MRFFVAIASVPHPKKCTCLRHQTCSSFAIGMSNFWEEAWLFCKLELGHAKIDALQPRVYFLLSSSAIQANAHKIQRTAIFEHCIMIWGLQFLSVNEDLFFELQARPESDDEAGPSYASAETSSDAHGGARSQGFQRPANRRGDDWAGEIVL